METANTKNYRYFLYSKSQLNLRQEVDRKINKTFSPGKVFNKGRWVDYTEISTTPKNSYADTKIVAEGYLEDMKYQNPTSIWGVR
jgi:hypothetical protein